MRIQVKDMMRAPVVTVVVKSDVRYVRELMERKEVNAIPVVDLDDEKRITIRGIITSTDLRGVTDESTPIEQLMSSKVHVVSKNASALAAGKMMLRHHVHHLVVMEDGRIIGMVSSSDFVKVVAEKPVASFSKVMFW